MPPKEKQLSNSDIAAQLSLLSTRLSLLGRKAHRAQTLNSRAEELNDDVALGVDEVSRAVNELRAMLSPPGLIKVSGPLREIRGKTNFLPSQAALGVPSVLLFRNADGSAEAEIGGHRIPLTPLLATLLDILKAEGGIIKDQMAGWKSFATVQMSLQESTKRHHSQHSIKQLVSRLRKALKIYGVSPDLVQTNKLSGSYRFALMRRGVETPAEQFNH